MHKVRILSRQQEEPCISTIQHYEIPKVQKVTRKIKQNIPGTRFSHIPEPQSAITKMQIAVLGPAGFGGSNVCVELLNRGHNLTGISRNPEKIGKHDRFRPYPLDLLTASIAQLIEAVEGQDAVINAFNPPAGPYMYSKTSIPNGSITTTLASSPPRPRSTS